MSIPNSQISDETLPSQSPSLVEDQQCEDEQDRHFDSQSSKTLISDHQDPENLAERDANNPYEAAQESENQQDSFVEVPSDVQIIDDADATSAPSPRNADINVAVSDATGRRGPKRKKMGQKRTAQEKKSREKFQVLVETLKPIPFVPAKALDFTSHETLLRRLGLWDFVHIEFDRSIRSDLVAQLIAGYTPSSRYCYVNGIRIMVNRADLGRALKLPVKKTVVTDDVLESLDLAESIAFIEEVVSNWMLLHEDTFIMPSEVLAYTKMIKEGHLEKVDWAGLIWYMVEKELRAPQLVNCYYASHLQQLIKVQREEFLREEPKVGIEVKDEEEEEEEDDDGSGDLKMGGVEDGSGDLKMGGVEDGSVDLKMGGVEDGSGDLKMGGVEDGSGELKMGGGVDDGRGELKMGGVEDGRAQELEEHNIELSLGQDNVEKGEVEREQDVGERIMDFEESKEEEPGQWLLDRKNDAGEPFLRQCNFSGVNGLDCEAKREEEGEEGQEGGEEGQEGGEDEGEEEEEEEAEEDEHEGAFHLPSKCIPLEGMSSGSLIQAAEAAQMSFGPGIELRDNSIGDFLSSREDAQMISGASLFSNGHKRDIGQDNNNSHHSLNGSNKRLRSDSPWNAKPVDFEMCLEQIEHWMGKARMVYAAKEQSCEDLTMHQQFLLNELQKRNGMIENLHKANVEENQKRQMEVYRLEKELYMMSSLLEGYRKALKETQKAFAEYRARCPQADEPLYKDVPGSGGLVLSVMELEKERLKQEEEERMKRLVIEKKLKDFEGGWITKLEDHLNGIQLLGNRLLAIEDQVKDLNELNAKCKASAAAGCAPSEEQTA